ncbi:MAG: hypothetical protein AAFO94_04485, partial [Bacteroidota bacterium]
ALDDNCDDNPVASWVVKEEDGSVVDAGTGVIGLTLEPGAYLVEWTGKDDCGNESEIEEQNLTVVDDDEPICYADQFTVVPLNDDGDGSVRVCADNLDSGSRDNCTVPELRIKKMNDSADTPFTKCITLSCADLDADCGSGVMVRFRAYDNIASTADAVPDVTFNLPEGGSARFSECMVQVALQDKKPPALSNPEDKALACEDIDADDLNALFDKPTATDNCDADPVVEIVSTTGGLNNCGVGAVTRTWVAVDKCGNRSPEVSQTVTVSSGATYTVTFPADVEVFNCDSDAALPTADGAGIPTVDGATAPCQNILISDPDTDGFEKRYTDQDGNCTKIVRTWCVMNWCVYDAARDNFKADPEVGERTFTDGGDGIICYTQVIKVVPAPAECSTVAEGTQFELDQPNNGDVFDPENFVEVNITADMIDDGSTGYDELKLDFGTGEVDDATFGCKDISLPGVPNNIPVDLILKIDGETALTCSTTIQVVDKVKPAIICGSTQQLVIPAADGELYTFSNDDVNRLTEVPFDNCGAVTAVFSPASLTFDAGSTQTVDITFSDPSGNTFTCTDIPVASSSITKPSIAGTIANENGEAVDEVMVEVNNGQMPGMMTKEDGAFEFTGLELNGSYTVTPEKDRNPLNGVSTFDLILISQHILGSQELSSPYQLIAADVNKSGGISVADMVEIRQLILNIISDYQSNTSWRFVDGDFEFSDPSDPWATPFPEVFNITDLSADQMDMSFVGVKVGDVDGNAIPNQRIATQGRTANGTLNLMAEDRFVQQGEQVVLSLSANEKLSNKFYFFVPLLTHRLSIKKRSGYSDTIYLALLNTSSTSLTIINRLNYEKASNIS